MAPFFIARSCQRFPLYCFYNFHFLPAWTSKLKNNLLSTVSFQYIRIAVALSYIKVSDLWSHSRFRSWLMMNVQNYLNGLSYKGFLSYLSSPVICLRNLDYKQGKGSPVHGWSIFISVQLLCVWDPVQQCHGAGAPQGRSLPLVRCWRRGKMSSVLHTTVTQGIKRKEGSSFVVVLAGVMAGKGFTVDSRG